MDGVDLMEYTLGKIMNSHYCPEWDYMLIDDCALNMNVVFVLKRKMNEIPTNANATLRS